MNEIVDNCDRCGKCIPTGSAYVCITRNIEQIEHCIESLSDDVEVLHSEMLISLCGSCGNKFDADTLVKLISIIPGDPTEISLN